MRRFEFTYWHATRGRISIVADGETESSAERTARKFFHDRVGSWPNRPVETIEMIQLRQETVAEYIQRRLKESAGLRPTFNRLRASNANLGGTLSLTTEPLSSRDRDKDKG